MLAVVSITATSSLSACGAFGPGFQAEPSAATRAKPCPPLFQYTEQEQQQAGREMDRLGPDSQLWRMMDHYLYMRDACR